MEGGYFQFKYYDFLIGKAGDHNGGKSDQIWQTIDTTTNNSKSKPQTYPQNNI